MQLFLTVGKSVLDMLPSSSCLDPVSTAGIGTEIVRAPQILSGLNSPTLT